MIKTKIQSIISTTAFLLLCFSQKGLAQEAAAITTSPVAEKIYVHTDKEEYLAGEMLWFKTYLLNGATLKPVSYNSIVYIEILGSNKAAMQAKIPIRRNEGDGCFYLPANLPTGLYTVLAYTNYLKKAGNKFYFRKRIKIINTFTPLPAVKVQSQPNNNIWANFYPEGGTVLSGEQTKFGFCVLDPSTKKGLQARGIIINKTNDTIATFSTLQFGLGQVSFKPLPNETYTAVIYSADGNITRKELPSALTSGYALSVQDAKDGKLKITTAIRSANDLYSKEKAYLIIHARQTSRVAIELEIDHQTNNEYFIEKSKLGTGVIYFTLINAKGDPVCERLSYIPPLKSTATIDIQLEKKDFGTREKINIGLSLYNAAIADSGIFNGSMAVSHTEATGNSSRPTIYEHFWLGADLYGDIESPSFYFTDAAKENADYFENLMLVHGWRRFNNTAGASKPLLELFPEYAGHIVAARVLDNWSNAPKPGVPCTLSVPSSPMGFYTATSDSNGIVRFSVHNYFGPGSIVIKATSDIKPNPYKIEIIDPFVNTEQNDPVSFGFTINRSDSLALLQKSIAMQATNTYQHDNVNRFLLPARTDTLPFYGKPEFSYSLDNYTRFSTMEEVLREYVAPVTVALKGNKLQLSMYDEKYQRSYNENMLVLLDGVPLSDVNQIFQYDPAKVKKIEVVPRRYLFGANSYFGIASFETYNGQFNATEIDPSAILIDYEGLQLKREFYSPVYSNEDRGNPRIPDYRTTLLWIPFVALNNHHKKELSIYSSDFPGNYTVVVCGFTSSGEPVQGSISFRVK